MAKLMSSNAAVDPQVSCQNLDEWQSSNVSDNEFKVFSKLILEQAGIEIPPEKRSLLEVRLNKRVRTLGLNSFSEYLAMLLHDREHTELTEFINALTTNTTAFFRESFHFDYLLQHLESNPAGKDTYFWSAACSSGEEVYTLAMVCEEFSRTHPEFTYKVLGTDIDTERLAMSTEAIYEKDKLEEIPHLMQLKYLSPTSPDPAHFAIAAELKRHIKFRQHNLIAFDASPGITFNYIFLRNVLFYFPMENIRQVISKLERHLSPGGLLFVGLTETLHHLDTELIQVAPSVYQKPLG
ncbi:hypothetical protein L2750_22765 [Shewanella submarina]|uniref:Chemotaxis protein methyltransferase n=1 Tax=Shewanella submarina TaxID=2016376 RepID=A0ABV7GDC4_9GAMM|nr:CheR family methyltransferase [Shewanella submarina]MCL1039926.1 hypothetical protein [Shewanella submarina]